MFAAMGTFAQTLNWDGISAQRVRLAHISDYNLGKVPFTMEAVIKAETGGPGYPVIISGRSSSSFTGFFISLNPSGALTMQMDGINMAVSTSGDLRDGLCHHIAVVRDGVNVSYYVDGVFAGFATTGGTGYDITIGTDWYIGNDAGSSFSQQWKGEIKEVRVWDIPRTATEIADNMDNRLASKSSGMIGYYRLTEGSGQDVVDYAFNANNGLLGTDNTVETEDPEWVTGGCALSSEMTLTFDEAPDSYITVPANDAYDFGTSDFTVEATINASSSSTDYSHIISARGTQPYNGFFFGINGSGILTSQLDGINMTLSSSADLRDDLCHHVALVREGAVMAYYVDGVFTGLAASSANGYDITGDANLTIGNDEANSYRDTWDGQISEVRIWNVARSESELQDNADEQLAGNETGLVGYFPLNEGEGQDANDLSTIGNNGVLGSDNLVETEDPIWETNTCHPLITSVSNAYNNSELTAQVYPLPLGESLQIELAQDGETPYVIYAADMTVVSEGIIETSGSIDLPELSNGVYFLRLSTGANDELYKLIK